ncbi:5'/3'-nucleotidase SurE [Desulfococcaceae bacterium HSG7]|nr:5'/3'-nucleotidase SurE [Desulfococcaceae bacterium HSG7]
MKILLTNDDGIYAQGLWALHDAFTLTDTAFVVAPDRERSAAGHGITLNEPLRIKRMAVCNGNYGYAVNGTPADCVKLGFQEILKERPDIVVSGINPGANVGINLNYSGTVGAAREASLNNIPAIAVSVYGWEVLNYEAVSQFIKELAAKIVEEGLPFGVFLNVNIPNKPWNEIQGIQISKQGISAPPANIEKRTDPRKREYYWQGCDIQKNFKNSEIDSAALERDYISITPIQCDMTDYKMIDQLKQWPISLNGR